jgi:hypothetical protein
MVLHFTSPASLASCEPCKMDWARIADTVSARVWRGGARQLPVQKWRVWKQGLHGEGNWRLSGKAYWHVAMVDSEGNWEPCPTLRANSSVAVPVDVSTHRGHHSAGRKYVFPERIFFDKDPPASESERVHAACSICLGAMSSYPHLMYTPSFISISSKIVL